MSSDHRQPRGKPAGPTSADDDQIAKDAPLRLDVAAALAFPDGTMKVAGLRREAARGRLAIFRIAGKDYTTLAAIDDMIEKCLVQPKEPVAGSGPKGSLATTGDKASLDALLLMIQKPSGRGSRG